MKLKIVTVSLFLLCWTQSVSAESINIPVLTIALEARGESLEGQMAAAEVIRNRANKAHSTFETVCLAPYQFSCWNGRKTPKMAQKEVSGQAYQRAFRAWTESESSNLTNGATHYHALSVRPYWIGKRKGITIGNHRFYRGIR